MQPRRPDDASPTASAGSVATIALADADRLRTLAPPWPRVARLRTDDPMTRLLRASGFALLLAASLVAAPAATLGPTTGAPTTDNSGTLAGTGPTGAGTLASPAGDGSAASDADASATDGVLDGPSSALDGPSRVVDGPNASAARERSKLSSSLRARLSGGDESDSTSGTTDPTTQATADSTVGTTADSTTSATTGTQRAEVVVVAAPGRGDDVARAARGLGGSVGTQYREHVEVRLPLQAVEALADRPAVRHVREPATPTTLGTVSEGVERMRADEVHGQGLTGENATIAVIDVAFDAKQSKYAEQVVAAKNFSDDPGFSNDTSDSLHGTASAEAVADVAPNASIALAAIRTASDFLDAVDWIENETEADAVTMSLGWQPNVGPLDGTDFISERIETSVNRSDLVWTVAAGNSGEYPLWSDTYGGKHWNGSYSEVGASSLGNDSGEYMDFGVRDSHETILPIYNARDMGGRIVVTWDAGWNAQENFSARLWGDDGSATTLLGTSNTTRPVEQFDVPANSGYERLYLEVERDDASTDHRFDVFLSGKPGGNDALWFLERDEYTTQRSILIPATSPDVLSVGAVDQHSDVLEGYSSRGPTIDGRRGIDVSAPTEVSLDSTGSFTGTSAATPHVGGLAALLAGANQSASDEWIRSRIERSGRSISGDGANQTPGIVQSEVGSGHVDALTATGVAAGISRCRNVSLSGTYALTQSIAGTDAAPCLRVTADDVTIDGRSHAIDGDGSHAGIVVEGADDVTIEGVAVTNRSTGIAVRNASNVTVRGVEVRHATRGVDLSGARDSVVANAIVRDVTEFAYRERDRGGVPAGSNALESATLPSATVSLTGANVTLADATGGPSLPTDVYSLGHRANVSSADGRDSSRANLSIQYAEGDLGNVAEGTLGLWRHAGNWSEVDDAGVDAAGDVAWADATFSGTVALAARAGTLNGTVTDDDGTPLANATVDLDTATVTPASTGANGTYRLPGVSAEVTHALNVSARGYDRNASVNATVPPNGTATANATLVQRDRYVGVDGPTAPGTVDAGESVEVSATATNFGATNWTTDVELVRNETTVANRTTSLNATETETLAFSTSVEDAGTYALSIATPNETRTTTIDVQSNGDGGGGGGGGLLALGGSDDSDDGGEPDLSIASAAVETAAVAVGESVTVEATVRNDGDAGGSRALTLRADGTPVDSTTVAVDAGATATATLSTTFDEPGRYELSVDDERAGTVEVGDPGSGDGGSGNGTDDGATGTDAGSGDGAGGDGLPGFGALPALLALLVVAARVSGRPE